GAGGRAAWAARVDEPFERGRAGQRRGGGLGPERRDVLLGEQREPEPGRDLREMREDALESAVARVADHPDVHECAGDASAASARTRAAIALPVRPASASCWARGACS